MENWKRLVYLKWNQHLIYARRGKIQIKYSQFQFHETTLASKIKQYNYFNIQAAVLLKWIKKLKINGQEIKHKSKFS